MGRFKIGKKDINGRDVKEGDLVKHFMPQHTNHSGYVHLGKIEFVEEVSSFRTVGPDGLEEPIHMDIELEVLSLDRFIGEITSRIFSYIIDNGELIPEEKCAQMAVEFMKSDYNYCLFRGK